MQGRLAPWIAPMCIWHIAPEIVNINFDHLVLYALVLSHIIRIDDLFYYMPQGF